MRVLVCHSFYKQPGGEDRSFAHESELLERHGHEVVRFTRDNGACDEMSRASLACRTIWNRAIQQDLRETIRTHQPDVMHCTNTFPLMSPAVFYAARREGVPVVQSLRNYRISCVRGDFHREGAVCESCKGRFIAWGGLRHRCYRDSLAASAVVAGMQSAHRLIGTWSRAVDQYIALTEFSRSKFVECGLPAERIRVKPNFVLQDPGAGQGQGRFALFVGRLSTEKGVDVLLDAWRTIGQQWPLKVVGDGPLEADVRAAHERGDLEWLGHQPEDVVLDLMGEARGLVMTSTCFENFPRTIVESFAKGTPVLASRLGAMAELVTEGETGSLFTPGDANDLVARVNDFLANSPEQEQRLRRQCRQQFLERYTADANHQMLMEIYQKARELRN